MHGDRTVTGTAPGLGRLGALANPATHPILESLACFTCPARKSDICGGLDDAEIRDLAARARAKQLAPDEVLGGTFTITNPGPYGTYQTIPIINQPQVAILATDGITKRPRVVQGPDGADVIAVRHIGMLGLTWDHRAFDGAYAASFLGGMRDRLEQHDWASELD